MRAILFAALMALGTASPALASGSENMGTAVAIALVGLVYSLALRAVWNPTGWQAVADHALHDATPPLFLLAWALSSHGELAWRDALHAILPPFAYCLYAFVRGAADVLLDEHERDGDRDRSGRDRRQRPTERLSLRARRPLRRHPRGS